MTTPADVIARRAKRQPPPGRVPPAGAAPAHHDRLATQFRITQQLDRSEEGIHVEVGDASNTVHKNSIANKTRPVAPGRQAMLDSAWARSLAAGSKLCRLSISTWWRWARRGIRPGLGVGPAAVPGAVFDDQLALLVLYLVTTRCMNLWGTGRKPAGFAGG